MFPHPVMKRSIAALLVCLLPTGAIAEDTILEDFSGNPAKIEDYTGQGKWLAVMYWASDCHVCNVEAHQYAAFHHRHKDSDATVLGVSLDGKAGKAAAEQFIRRHQLEFPNLIGESDLVSLQYTFTTGDTRFGTPSFLLYDPQGELKAAQLGAVPVEKIEAFINKHSPTAAAEACTVDC